jgi:LPXTG-motif cell wall-anchored protein
LFLGTILAVVSVFPGLAAAQGGEPCCHGRLIVEKTVQGNGPDQFGFNVICNDDSGVILDRAFTLTMVDGTGSKDFDGVNTGAVCAVKETDDGGADSTTVSPEHGMVVIGNDDPVTVSFVNVFEAPTTTTTTTAAPTTTTTTAAPTTTTTTAPTVLGVTVTKPPAELPRTGSSPMNLVIAGLSLIALGAYLRRRTAKVTA